MSESPSSRKAVWSGISQTSPERPGVPASEVAAGAPHTIEFGPAAIHGDGLHDAMSRGRGPCLSTDRRPISPAFLLDLLCPGLRPPPPEVRAAGAGRGTRPTLVRPAAPALARRALRVGPGPVSLGLVPPVLAGPQPGRSAPPEVRTSGHRRHHAHQAVPGGSEHPAARTFGRRRHDRDLPGSSEPAGRLTKPDLRLPAGVVAPDALAVCPDPGRAPHALVREAFDELVGRRTPPRTPARGAARCRARKRPTSVGP